MNNIVSKAIKVAIAAVVGFGAYKLGGKLRDFTAKHDIQKFQKCFDNDILKSEINLKEQIKALQTVLDEKDKYEDQSKVNATIAELEAEINRLKGRVDALKEVRDAEVEVK